MRWRALRVQRTTDGSNVAAHLQEAARMDPGSAAHAVLADVEAPEYPEEMGYLVQWLDTLFGRSGYLPSGAVAPLSYSNLQAWATLRSIELTPFEVDALIMLDDVMRQPQAFGEKEEKAGQVPGYAQPTFEDVPGVIKMRASNKPWPKRKPGVEAVLVPDNDP